MRWWPFKRKPKPEPAPEAAAEFVRYFEAGETSRLWADWDTVAMGGNQLVARYLPTLRARSRAEAANNAYAARYVALQMDNVAGPRGFDLQCDFRLVNGKKAEPDTVANKVVEDAWRRWSKPANCDVLGQQHLAGLQRAMVRSAAVDGEICIRLFRGPQFGPFGFQIQVFDPELIDFHYNDDLPDGRVRFGIKYDSLWRPVSYYLRQPGIEDSAYAFGYSSGDTREEVPAADVIFSFIPWLPDTLRGFPWLHACLPALHLIHGAEEAAVVAMREGANVTQYFTNNAAPGVENSKLQQMKESFTQPSEPGTKVLLPPGVEAARPSFNYPSGEFAPFVNQELRRASAGAGVAHYSLSQDMSGVNFSTAQIGRIDDQDGYMATQEWVGQTTLSRLYDEWLKMQLLLETLKIGDAPLASARREKYSSDHVHFYGRRWQPVDPEKQAKADALDLQINVTSPQQIMRRRGIPNHERVWAELIESREIFGPAADVATGMSQQPTDTVDDGDTDDEAQGENDRGSLRVV